MVVARVGDDITFRQLVVEAGRSYLKPLNNLYPLTPAKDATICGVVVGKAYEPIL
jgi:SOS-response transcriptional repressor LexA